MIMEDVMNDRSTISEHNDPAEYAAFAAHGYQPIIRMSPGYRMLIIQLSEFLEAVHGALKNFDGQLPEPEPTITAALGAIRTAADAVKIVRERR
jgi:hypothetical protein